MTEWLNRVHFGDCLETLRRMPDGIAQTCVTSPPYYGLRDYGHAGQIGLEATPDEFVGKLLEVFREVRRVLRDDGTLWLNLGDSYATGAGKVNTAPGGGTQGERWSGVRKPDPRHRDAARRDHGQPESNGRGEPQGDRGGHEGKQGYRVGPMQQPNRMPLPGLKPKDLIGIPWRVAFALQADGWWLRQDIIWHKPNHMPESIKDRCTKSHEYVFLLAKSHSYYFDHGAIAEPVSESTVARMSQDVGSQIGSDRVPGKTNGPMKAVLKKSGNTRRKPGAERGCPEGTGSNVSGSIPWEGSTRSKRSVWTVTTKPYTGAHFAVFPPDLIEPCILAGAPAGGVVLDPFFGSGTTGEVAQRLGRAWIGLELNPEYEPLQRERLRQPGLELISPEAA